MAILWLLAGSVGCDTGGYRDTDGKARKEEHPLEKVVIYDGGLALKAGQSIPWKNMSGQVQVEVSSNDGVDIWAFPSEKDFRLYRARETYDYLPGCSAQQSTRFVGLCVFKEDGVFAVYNKNWLSDINVDVRITVFK